jgi:hypothetical protein
MKTWTYEEITTYAEKEIISFMEAAKILKDKPYKADDYHSLAQGVFFLWNGLTMGWRSNNGDEERLKALLNDRL